MLFGPWFWLPPKDSPPPMTVPGAGIPSAAGAVDGALCWFMSSGTCCYPPIGLGIDGPIMMSLKLTGFSHAGTAVGFGVPTCTEVGS